MSRLFYDIFLALYSVTARLIAPFDPKAKKWAEGRKRVWDELGELKTATKKRAWFHCASLGEYEQALPLIEKVSVAHEIIITFFSPSGYEVAKRKNPGALIFYLPHDSKSNARKFIDVIQPELAVFMRYDLWYYYLTALRQRQIQTILVGAVFNKQQVFFQWYGGLFREMLRCFTHLFVLNDESKELLKKIGIVRVTKAGDPRIDRVVAIRQASKSFPLIERFKGSKKLFIIGSLEPKDEKIVLPVIDDPVLAENFKFIIAPHDIAAKNVKRLATIIKRKTILYSEAESNLTQGDVLMIDSIGMLSSIYRYAEIAYIGGGFGEGLHNILEPAAWGVPLLFGPKYQKFLEAGELAESGGAVVIKNPGELKTEAKRWLSDKEFYETAKTAVSEFIHKKKGGTIVIYSTLFQ